MSCRRKVLCLEKVQTWMRRDQMKMERYCKSHSLAYDVVFPSSINITFVLGLSCYPDLFSPSRSIHSSESQQEFFRMLDEKIEKVWWEDTRDLYIMREWCAWASSRLRLIDSKRQRDNTNHQGTTISQLGWWKSSVALRSQFNSLVTTQVTRSHPVKMKGNESMTAFLEKQEDKKINLFFWGGEWQIHFLRLLLVCATWPPGGGIMQSWSRCSLWLLKRV